MKTKILGAYSFESKNGKKLVNLSVTDDRINAYGVTSVNLMAMADSFLISNNNFLIRNNIF